MRNGLKSDSNGSKGKRSNPLENQNGIDPMFVASIAAGECLQGETVDGDIVPTPTDSRPIDNDNPNPSETPTNTKRFIEPKRCEHCGREFVPRHPRRRFCNANCRRGAWLERNPERAAELAERDRARLRDHILATGGEWVER